MTEKEELLNHLELNTCVLKTLQTKEAFSKIDRKDFVLPDYESEAYEDYALPIGFEQTISQPTTVAFMLELLDVKRGEKVLDIGSGSGWTTALLAELVGKKGKVFGVETIPELVEQGRRNLQKYNFSNNAEIRQATDTLGLPELGPFDKILISASAETFPRDLLNQLRNGGVMVVPIGDTIYKITKTGDSFDQKLYPGFVFVPLIQ